MTYQQMALRICPWMTPAIAWCIIWGCLLVIVILFFFIDWNED